MRKLFAFLLRDLQVTATYRAAVVMVILNLVLTLVPYFFIAKLIDPHGTPVLERYGGAYFPFVLLGLAGSRFLALVLQMSHAIRDEQSYSTLEALLATPTTGLTLLLGITLSYVLWAIAEFAVCLGIAAVCFRFDLSQVQLLPAAIVLGLTALSLGAVGVFSACGALLFKDADPLNWIVVGLTAFMRICGGVYFPVALLPDAVQGNANVLPLTYGLEGLRLAILKGHSLQELAGLCGILAGFSVVLWPAAVWSIAWAVKRLRQTGSLDFR